MTGPIELLEQTKLADAYFPINVFDNSGQENILGLHWHEHFEILYMMEGEAVFHIGNRSFSARTGDLLFVGSGQLHTGYSIGNAYVRYYAVVFKKTFLSSPTPDYAHQHYLAPLLEGKLHFPEKVATSDEHYTWFQPLVERLIEEFIGKKAGYELAVKSYLQLLVAATARYYAERNGERRERADARLERFQPLFEHIANHYDRRISVEDAAGLIHVSPHYFSSLFKKVVGFTFIDYVQLVRVNEAEQLLQTTELPITQIAERVGFCNINYFDRVFRRVKQYPPSRLRKVGK